MLNAQGRNGLPKGASTPLAERGEGEGESDERALLGAFGVDSRGADRLQAVSKPSRLKYWVFVAFVIFAVAAATGAFILVPGVEDRHLAPFAGSREPNAAASVSDLAARLQALQTAPSQDASAPAVAASSAVAAPSPEPLKNVSSVAAANVEAPPVAPQTAPENAVRGVSDTQILFGMAAPFSGASRELGRQMKIGVETAFDQINSAGGANGRQLQLVAVDDGYEPARTADAMRVLYDKDRVFGFIGNVGTPTAAVALPFALDHRALFFGAFSGANLLRRDPPDRYVFNYRASYAEETNAVVRYLVNVRRIQPSEIVVFAQQDFMAIPAMPASRRRCVRCRETIRTSFVSITSATPWTCKTR